MDAGWVNGDGFTVDASSIKVDASRLRAHPKRPTASCIRTARALITLMPAISPTPACSV
jgi:hypothetical protein